MTVDRLRLIYDVVDGTDLLICGVSEAPVPGALLGPTLRCIAGDQCVRQQHGDRFYYANPAEFTEEQLAEVLKSSRHCNALRYNMADDLTMDLLLIN